MGEFKTNQEFGKPLNTFPSRWHQVEASIAEAIGVNLDQQFSGRIVLKQSDLNVAGGVAPLNASGKLPITNLKTTEDDSKPFSIPKANNSGLLSPSLLPFVSTLGSVPISVVSSYNTAIYSIPGFPYGNPIIHTYWSNESPLHFPVLLHNQETNMLEPTLVGPGTFLVIVRYRVLFIPGQNAELGQIYEGCVWIENVMRGTRSSPQEFVFWLKTMTFNALLVMTSAEYSIASVVSLGQGARAVLRCYYYSRPFSSKYISLEAASMPITLTIAKLG